VDQYALGLRRKVIPDPLNRGERRSAEVHADHDAVEPRAVACLRGGVVECG
jgi:hypothetical protein